MNAKRRYKQRRIYTVKHILAESLGPEIELAEEDKTEDDKGKLKKIFNLLSNTQSNMNKRNCWN